MFQQAGPKPVEFSRHIALDGGDMHGDDTVATRLQPCLPKATVFFDGFGFIGIDQFDRYPVHERNKIRNVPADRGLAFELPGKTPIGSQAFP